KPVLSQQCLMDALDSLDLVAAAATRTPMSSAPVASNGRAGAPAGSVAPEPRPTATRVPEPAGRDACDPAPLRIGRTVGVRQSEGVLRLEDLGRHAAFRGGSGSGKTTLALAVLEAAALRGVPAILVDRKGDLGVYADPAAWERVEPEHRARADRLRAELDVDLYTPGEPHGRDLAVPLLPPAGDRLSDRERESIIRHYASALVGLLPVAKASEMRTMAIVGHGLEILDACRDDGHEGADLTVSDLAAFLRSGDPALTNALASFQPRQIRKIAEDLEALVYTQPILRP